MNGSARQEVTPGDVFAAPSAATPAAEGPVLGEQAGVLNVRAADEIKRKFTVRIEGSLRDFEANGAKWTVSEENLDVMRRSGRYADDGKRSGDLSRVLPLEMTMRKTRNPYTMDVGIKITGVKGNVYGDAMEKRIAAWAPAGYIATEAETVFAVENRAIEAAALCAEYGNVNEELLAKGVLPHYDSAKEFCYVMPGSLVGGVIVDNARDNGLDLAAFQAILDDEVVFRVGKAQVDTIQSTIRKALIDNNPYTNFNAFEVELVRMDGRRWTDPEGSDTPLTEELLGRRMAFTTELDMHYIIHDKGAPKKE